MPPRREDLLIGYGVQVVRRQDQPVGPSGPIVNEDGTPKLVTFHRLMFLDPAYQLGGPGGHAVMVDLVDSDRDDVVRLLTSGIMISNGSLLGVMKQ